MYALLFSSDEHKEDFSISEAFGFGIADRPFDYSSYSFALKGF